MKRLGLTVLGATGSIGQNTLDVVKHNPERYSVIALTALSNVQKLFEQCLEFQPRFAAMVDHDAAEQLEQKLKTAGAQTTVLSGPQSLSTLSSHADNDIIMASIVGSAGLEPTLAAIKAGKRILLANKEALVMGGQFIMEAVKENAVELLPVDSEHNAIFQAMPGGYLPGYKEPSVQSITLTASGGPFLNHSTEQLTEITPEEACAHPNWIMGQKISVDSATMMNKGLEVIEAYWLFNLKLEQIKVTIHPQSVIHSMVHYHDGSVLAQLGQPDMRIPIANVLGWPERIASGAAPLELEQIAQLDFRKADFEQFPCLRLAYESIERGHNASIILNAANEVAVDAFLNRKIPFLAIAKLIESTLEQSRFLPLGDLSDAITSDNEARLLAESLIPEYANRSLA